jgi:putative resolvase
MDGSKNHTTIITTTHHLPQVESGPVWANPHEASSQLGVTAQTLRKWAKADRIPTRTTTGGHRRYNIQAWTNPRLSTPGPSRTPIHTKRPGTLNLRQNQAPPSTETQASSTGAIYCRVSSRKQRDDLQRQIETLQEEYPHHRVFKDVASGLNFKGRKGLQRLLEQVQKGVVKEVVVAHRDRLARFSIDVIEWILRQAGATLVVLHDQVDPNPSPEQELTEDLMAIVDVFSCRFNGKRRYRQTHQGGKDAPIPPVPGAEAEAGSGPPPIKRHRTPNTEKPKEPKEPKENSSSWSWTRGGAAPHRW